MNPGQLMHYNEEIRAKMQLFQPGVIVLPDPFAGFLS